MSRKTQASQYADPNGAVLDCETPNSNIFGYSLGTPTYARSYWPGAIVIDITNGIVYTNTGTQAANVWTNTGATEQGTTGPQGGAVTITGGTSTTSANAGGAVTITGGTPGATGAGGAVNITSGAGGATSGAAGAINITVGSATNGAGANITLTAGNGASGTSAGGNVNLVPGTAVSTGTPGEVQVNGNSAIEAVSFNYTAALVTQTFFTATRAVRVKAILGRVRVQGTGGACTIQFFKVPSGTAVGSGTALDNASTFNLVGTVDTNQTITLSSTVATRTLAAGDSVGYVLTGTATSAVGNVTLHVVPV